MAEIQHSQIKSKLLETTAASVDVSDIQGRPAADFEAHLLSRCIAITALRMAAGIDLATAAASLVDGGKDNGIDAIYYDPQTRTLFLVQSKWSAAHSAAIDSAGVLKFIQGTQDLVS